MDWAIVKEKLQEPLSREAIKPPPKGKFGEYVDALHIIREANRIFGEDGWSYTVTRLELVSNGVVQLTGNNGPYEQLRVGYLCAVRLDVDGVIREGTAVGSGMGNPNSAADHHEAAVKEAETDALKRAFRTFGNTFGLALYEKDKDKREVADAPPPPRDPETVAKAMVKAAHGAADARALTLILDDANFEADLDWMAKNHKDVADRVNAFVTGKKRELGMMPEGE